MLPKLKICETVYQNRYHRIGRVEAQFDGFQKEYFVNYFGPKASLLVADQEQNVLLVRQYRLLVNQLAWEIPGGKVDDGEKPDTAAARETFEETGVKCHEVKPLLFTHPGLDTFENPTYIFYSESFEKSTFISDPREVVEAEWVPMERLLQMIFNGEIVDSMTIAALLAYKALKENPQLVIKRP